MNGQYEVLSPWAEADPVPLRGISPRLTGLNNKTIGLFDSGEVAASPIQTVVEKKLKERFLTVKISQFIIDHSFALKEPKEKARFEEWVKGVDAVILAVGD